mgnify:CR=1 FL=1
MDSNEIADEIWLAARATLFQVSPRNEIVLQEVPAPARLAPNSIAFSAEVNLHESDEIASGKFVVLHDPDGQPTWSGTFRVVTFVNADVEADVVTDELFDEVAWSWLTESLDNTSATYDGLSGTVTRTASRSFAQLADRDRETQLEIRASWSPLSQELSSHLSAWCELLERAAGLEPLPEGVTSLSRKFQ